MDEDSTQSNLLGLLAKEWDGTGPPGIMDIQDVVGCLSSPPSELMAAIDELFVEGMVDMNPLKTAVYLTPEGYARRNAGTLSALTFDNRFTRELPADPETANRRRQVVGACYAFVQPTKVASPELVAYAREAAALLDLSDETCKSDEFAQVFSGNRLLNGMAPYATCYGGHQFGNWAGQLGDGRAINLGEIINRRSERWALQLKGAGPTPFARTADGRAVLRSSIREFLCSEAMFHLGVPTTRALSLVLTGEQIERDMFYDGHPKMEPGAVVCRMAPTFTRFGNFQIFASRGDTDVLKQLVDELEDLPYQILVIGNTDNVPVGAHLAAKYPNNWYLAGARAASVVTYMEQQGVPSAQLVPVSWGQEHPVQANDTEEGRAENRRIEVRLRPVIRN